jgi:hypothetical protein
MDATRARARRPVPAAGKYKGRAPNARARSDDVRRIPSQDTTKEAIARVACISVASVYRILATSKRLLDVNPTARPKTCRHRKTRPAGSKGSLG